MAELRAVIKMGASSSSSAANASDVNLVEPGKTRNATFNPYEIMYN